MVKGFGRRPLARLGKARRGRRSKASQGGNRVGEGRWRRLHDLWGFENGGRSAANGCSKVWPGVCRVSKSNGLSVVTGRIGFGLCLSPRRGCHGPVEQGRCSLAIGQRGEQTAVRCDRRRDPDHEVSILIRLGKGPARPKVSTTIMRPPQHGHRRRGSGGSASPGSSAAWF
jgi:hypothetical protein